VTSAVKQSAGEVVKSVQHTDWKSELAVFTQEVEAEAHKAVEVVQHLPQHIALPHEQQQQGTRLSRISEVRGVGSSSISSLLAVTECLQEASSCTDSAVGGMYLYCVPSHAVIWVAELRFV
jgi:hypothetical protein